MRLIGMSVTVLLVSGVIAVAQDIAGVEDCTKTSDSTAAPAACRPTSISCNER